VGLLQGFVITRFGLPSFVATLGGLLAWQGALLYVLGPWGTLNITDTAITGIASSFLSAPVSIALVVLVVVAYAADRVRQRRRRQAVGLATIDIVREVVPVVLLGAGLVVGVIVFSAGRGVPLVLVIVLALAIALHWILTRTIVGRYVYAVGGNGEAAQRAGVNVTRIRIAIFAAASTLAAFGGILAASRLLAVNQTSGSGDLLLLAIAGPVIGGVSLFGGIGTVWMALLGIVIIGSIANGMDLLQIESSVRYMLTGAILVVAVIVDATSRKRRKAAGRE
jgi:D-xylose transport system permease protein